MELDKQQKSEILALYQDWLASYINGNVETYDSYFADDYHFIGSTDNEEYLSRKETTAFFESTAEQLAGKTELRNDIYTFEKIGDLVFITHRFDAWFLNGSKWNYYGRFRFTSALRKDEENWRFVYQHFSMPDNKALEGETIGYDQINEENRELREAIKRRTVELENKNRELAIEASLERVRARTMAMHSSSELTEASTLLDQQVRSLGIQTWGCAFHVYAEDEAGDYEWFSSANGSLPFYKTPREQFFLDFYERGKRGEKFYVKEFAEGECKAHYDFLKTIPVIGDSLKALEKSGIALPTYQIDHIAFFNHGYILFITYEPVPESHAIFQRFAKVFEQTYTRFLDLQKAEAQARESEIQLALERVRARTMAMQKSEELADAAFILFEQLRSLGGNLWGTGFGLCEENTDKDEFWFANENGVLPPVAIPNTTDPAHKRMYKGWQEKTDFLSIEKSGKALNDHYEYMLSLPEVRLFFQKIIDEGLSFPEKQQWNAAYFSKGYLLIITLEPYPDKEILKRFAKVFEQTYTRFLDLQKAEAQAREAQIEVAVERVRAKALAMHKSGEILQVAMTLKEQMEALNLSGVTAATIYLQHDESKIRVWDITELKESEQGPQLSSDFTFILEDTDPGLWVRRVWNAKEKYSVIEMSGDDFIKCEKWIREFDETAADNYREFIRAAKIEHTWHPTVQLEKGKLNLDFTVPPPPEMEFILPKMGAAFDLAYRRFLDLQKAESQAREAEIELGLERVRARAMAIRKSDELGEIIQVIFRELKTLGFDLLECSLVTFDKDSKDLIYWSEGALGSAQPSNARLQFIDHPMLVDLFKDFEKGVPYRSGVFSGNLLKTWWDRVFEETDFKSAPAEYISSWKKVKKVFYFQAFMTHGFLEFVGKKPLPENKANILKRFTRAVDLAYTRYDDVVNAESQAREAQIEAALEKVRSRSLAMHKSDELNEVVSVLFERLKELQIPFTAIGIGIYIEGSKDLDSYVCGENEAGLVITNYRLPHFENQIPKDLFNALEKQLDFYVGHYSKEEKDAFYNYVIENTAEFKHLPEDILRMIFDSPTYTISMVPVKNAVFNINDFEGKTLAENEIDIIKRFAKVFDQAYTRFLDLKKAEAQAREAQISLAVERVRARALAMFKSDEILEVVFKLKEEIMRLDIPGVAAAAILLKEKNGKFRSWDLTSFEMNGENMHLPLDIPFEMEKTDPGFYLRKVWKEGSAYSVIVQDEKSLQISCNWLREHHKIKEAEEAEQFLKSAHITKSYHPTYPLNQGRMILDLLEPPSQEIESILSKMGGAFDLAYKRFEDLEKAEAQAREALIEAALERIRGQVASMRESTELLEIVVTMRSEFVALGHEAHYFWHMRWLPGSYEKAMTSGDGTQIGMVMSLPRRIHGDIKLIADWEKGSDPILVLAMETEIAIDYVEKMITWGDFERVDPQAPTLDDIRHIGGLTFIMARTTHGEIGFSLPGSVPNPPQESMDTLVRFAKVFDLAYKRFEDLKKAEHQTRETQIELALERVRSRSMAMQRSEELQEVIQVVYRQFVGLEIPIEHTGFIMDYKNREDMNIWLADSNQYHSEITFPYFDSPHWNSYLEAKAKGENFFANLLDFETKNRFYQDLFSLIPDLPKETQGFYFAQEGLSISTVLLDNVGLYIENYTTIPFTDEENQVLLRFGKVFQQTYTRFLDLQKAEAQAREAQIEAALERIRSRSLAMHHSSELSAVVDTLLREFTNLEFTLTFCIINLIDEQDMSNTVWAANPETGKDPESYYMKFEDYPFHDAMWDAWKAQKKQFIYILEGDEKKIYDEYLYSETEFRRFPKHVQDANKTLERYVAGFTFFKYSGLQTVSEDYISEDDLNILERFGRVFEQAYTRFLDLQKAEAQAREAQIELSLERIRAQVTAMRQSDELFDIVVLMRKEFISLGHEADYFWHMKWTPENYDMSMTSEDGERVGMIISVPKFVHDEMPRLAEWEKSDSPIIALDLNGPEAWDYIDKMNTYGKYEQADPHAPSEEDIMAIGGLTFVIARTTHGEIGFSLPGQVPNPPAESTDTLIRFAGVFDLAYRRFEDLLTAEKQNRKAKIELALERVRARALAMQHPEELIEVAQVMREEMGLLGVEELETSSIYINKNTTGKAECWYSIKDIRDGAKTYVADHFDLNYQDTWVGRQMLDFYQSDETKTSILMKGEDRIEWINYCANQSPKLEGYYGTEIPERTYHLTKFSNGAIGAATPGEISSESWDLLRRAALVFSLAYSRFKDLSQAREDLKKLKKAKAKAEKALKDLEAAQEQLVQQEKLASLGQLTAGIAHEIKNPLNFVNNFSDLSRELIEEVFEELENVEDSDAKEEIMAILNDVKANLSKVHEHGARADSIVSSMLQHSRASGSKREAKPFNSLVQEFVNLSFHGMRAGKSPINVDIDLLLDPKVGDVTLISEDFSRVILNLCNNAFDAMRDKLKSGESVDYLPKLSVKTALQKDKVIFSVGDNGSGIPAEIKDKILQPFFTTKKGTEGTGLGLSITHDIIKAHGGEIKIESSPDQGSLFTISIPTT